LGDINIYKRFIHQQTYDSAYRLTMAKMTVRQWNHAVQSRDYAREVGYDNLADEFQKLADNYDAIISLLAVYA